MVVVLNFNLHDEYGLSPEGSYCYPKEWVCNSRIKPCCLELEK